MNASELNRKLLYRGHNDIADYLRNSPMNRCVYNLILGYGTKPLELPMLTIFNEIYYQCIRVNYDCNPGVDLSSRYLDEEAAWLRSRQSALLVFSIVWGLLRRKHDTTFYEQCFVEQFYPLIGRGEYERLAYILIKMAAGARLLPPKKVRTMPSSLDEIKGDKKAWREITNNFSFKSVENYIRLYTTIDEQRRLLDMMKKASAGSKDADAWCFRHIRESIDAGAFLPQVSPSEDPDYDEVKEIFYKEEYEKLREKYEWQESKHENQIISLNVRHQCEMEVMRKKLEQRTLEKKRMEDPGVLLFSFSEMVDVVKARFSKTAADEFSTMLYQLATKHGYLDEDISRAIDGIVPYIIERDTPQQNVDITTAHQVNISPQNVNNNSTKEK